MATNANPADNPGVNADRLPLIDALMALCDRLEASLTAAAAARRRLLDVLFAEALARAADRLPKAPE